MQLLDASLAFVLTLAALATVVTTIMEACLRIAKMRKKNLITVMKLLNDEIGKGPLKMPPQERWRFFSKVVENPASPGNLANKINWKDNDIENETALNMFLKSFGKRKDRKVIFNKVTLEYLLRCFSEIGTIQHAALETREMLQTELNRIARKYEEFGSAVSANFKQNVQAWSIAIGILLAISANVDGLRIFEAYRADPKLSAAVIAQLEKSKEVQEKESDLSNADAKDQIVDLVKLDIPIGWKFYPNGPSGLITTIKNDKLGLFVWLFKVIITGVLIGLGAPFWFDVAKRLSMIRKGLKNPNSSAEDRLAARDANGDADERKKIVDDVLSDICEEASVFGDMSNTTDPEPI